VDRADRRKRTPSQGHGAFSFINTVRTSSMTTSQGFLQSVIIGLMNRKGFLTIPFLVIGALIVFGIGLSAGIYLDKHKAQEYTAEPSPTSTSSAATSPTSSTTSPPPSLGPNEIHWADAITLINECQAMLLESNRYHFSGGDYITFKNGERKKIVESPGCMAIRSAAQAVSSTCGKIQLGCAIE